MWPMGRDIAIEVDVHVGRLLRTSLRREGFETDGDQCANFSAYIAGLLNFTGQAFNRAIADALADPNEHHSIQELVSWTVSDLEQFVGLALQSFQQRLVDQMTIDLSRSRPIRCAEAMSGTSWLPEICREAAHRWRSVASVPIRSLKFQRKRARQGWKPRDLDLASVIVEYFT